MSFTFGFSSFGEEILEMERLSFRIDFFSSILLKQSNKFDEEEKLHRLFSSSCLLYEGKLNGKKIFVVDKVISPI